MAYSRQKASACPIPADPGVLSVYIPLTTAEINVPVYIPWDKVKLVYAYAVYTGSDNISTALDGGDWEIVLELDEAGGTELMSATIASGAAVGDVSEATFSSEVDCENLMDSNIIMIESDGHADSTVGAAMVHMYFEHCS
jgi:hypothetical protein